MRVLGIITARGGSKSIPGKNIRPLAGKPLLQYTAESALAAKRLARVILSTDSPEIARVGLQCKVDVPFLRPPELAADDTPTLPVLQHAVGMLEGHGEHYDAICLLQPTAPLRTSEHIDRCIELLESGEADCAMTILPVPAMYHPSWVYFRNEDGSLKLATGDRQPVARRQELPPAYHREGSVYVSRRDIIMEQNSLYGCRTLGLVLDPALSVNLDEPCDWIRAEGLMKTKSRF